MRVNLPGQLDLPETPERTSDHVKRLAAAPLKARTPQRPCDHGLFGDDARQVDIDDLLRK